MVRTAEGGLSGTQDTLNRVRELTIQAGNGAYTDEEIGAIEQEINQLLESVDDTAQRTEFNTKKLLNGSGAGRVTSATPGVQGFVRGALSDYGSFEGSIRSTANADGTVTRELELRGRGGQTYSAVLDDSGRANGILPNLDVQVGELTSASVEGGPIASVDGFSFSDNVNATFTDQAGDSFSLSIASGTSLTRDEFLTNLNNGFTANNVDITASFDTEGNLRLNGDLAGQQFSVSGTDAGFSSAFGFGNQTVLAPSAVSSASFTGFTSSNVEAQTVAFNSAVTFDVSDGTNTANISLGGAATTLSLDQINQSINSQLQAAGVRASSSFNDNGQLSFESVDVGQSARVTVTDTSAGPSTTQNTLGLSSSAANGTGSSSFTLNVQKTGFSFQNGANQGQNAEFGLGDFSSDALGLRDFDLYSQEGRDRLLSAVDRASNSVSSARASIGAQENAFEAQYSNLQQSGLNASRTESLIRDVDVAQASVEQSKLDMQMKGLLFAQVQGLSLNTALLQRLLG